MPHMFAKAAEKKRRAIEKLAAAKPKKTRKKHAIAVVRDEAPPHVDEARRVQEANDNQDKARGTGGRRTRRRTRRSRRTTK
jgi:hypothetical protein